MNAECLKKRHLAAPLVGARSGGRGRVNWIAFIAIDLLNENRRPRGAPAAFSKSEIMRGHPAAKSRLFSNHLGFHLLQAFSNSTTYEQGRLFAQFGLVACWSSGRNNSL